MATVKELIEALSGLPQDERIVYSYWARRDIDAMLADDEQPPTTEDEWSRFYQTMTNDDALASDIWNAVSYWVEAIKVRREKKGETE